MTLFNYSAEQDVTNFDDVLLIFSNVKFSDIRQFSKYSA